MAWHNLKKIASTLLLILSVSIASARPCDLFFQLLPPTPVLPINLIAIQKRFPEIYQGVVRAIGLEKTRELFKDLRSEDLAPLEDKIDDFRRHLAEYIRDRNKSDSISIQYTRDLLGILAEAIAISEFRKYQPAHAIVTGDEAKGTTESSRHRPDGVSFVLKENGIRIFSLLEAKIGKSAKGGFNREQYTAMLDQWKRFGAQLGGRTFTPEQISFEIYGHQVALNAMTDAQFLDVVYLYQPTAQNLTPERIKDLGIKMVLPDRIERREMMYIANSILSSGLRLYRTDSFPQYSRDVRELVSLYRANQAQLPEKPADRNRAIDLLAKFDQDSLLAALAVLAPELSDKMRDDQRVHCPKLIAPLPSKGQSFSDFNAWKEGRLQIDNPIELIQLRVRYEPIAVFGEFLTKFQRLPAKIDTTQVSNLSPNRADLILEDRFASAIERAGGSLIYLFTVLTPKVTSSFLAVTGWRPSNAEIKRALNNREISRDAHELLVSRMTQAFGNIIPPP